MIRRHAQLRAVLLAGAEAVAAAAAMAASYWLRFGSGIFEVTKPWEPARYVEAAVPSLLLCLATFAAAGNYRPPRISPSGASDLRAAVGGVIPATLILAAAALFYRHEYQYSRGMILLFPLTAIPFIFLARRTAHGILTGLRRRGKGLSPALLVGSGVAAKSFLDRISERPWLGIDICERIEDAADLQRALEEHHPAQVFLAFPAAEHEKLATALDRLSEAMVDVRVVPDLGGTAILNPDVAVIGGLPVVTLRESPFHGFSKFLKRFTDIAFTLFLGLLLSPVLIVVSLLVKLTSRGPVLYHQERMGLDGRSFRIHKFRTMRVGAETETGAVWAKKDDPRRTGIGKILRRLSLDELPQLWNVMVGEMSLVGPRPERPEFIEKFRSELPRYMLRHRIPAGLTGWAQVHGLRGDTDVAARLRYDLAYLERWSLFFDLEILLRTVWQVVAGRNAM